MYSSDYARFSAPEGPYHLVFELNISPPPAPITVPAPGSAPPNTSSAVAAPGVPANTDASFAPVAPPPYPSKLATAAVRFPPAAAVTGSSSYVGGLLGAGKYGRTRELSMVSDSGLGANTTAGIGSPQAGLVPLPNSGTDGASAHSSEDPSSLPASATIPPASPTITGGPLLPQSTSQTLLPRKRTNRGLPTLSSLSTTPIPLATSPRPKAAFKGTNSAFVKSSEGLPLTPQALRSLHAPEASTAGEVRVMGVYTWGRTVVWCELAAGRPKEPLARLTFSAYPTVVAIHPDTASPICFDVLVGFATGDLLYFDPFCARYTRLNKGGCIVNSAVTGLSWIPSRDGLCVSGHADGSCVIWDKEREDPANFTVNSWPPPPLAPEDEEDSEGGLQSSWMKSKGKKREDRAEDIVVTPNTSGGDKKNKTNPMTHWRVSRKAVKEIAFSPDLQHCAVVSEDGCLRIIDAASERLLDTYASYFGALLCVCWSSDGRFVFVMQTGGQDDLVTVYSPLEQRVVARCQGHCSFVTSIAYDPWRSDERTSRFASVSGDCKIIFWDLSSAALSRPRAQLPSGRRHSITSNLSLSLSLSRRRTIESQTQLPSAFGIDREPMFHPAPGRREVAILQPVMVWQISNDPLSCVEYQHDGLMTTSRAGQIKIFARPPERFNPRHGNHSMVGFHLGKAVKKGSSNKLRRQPHPHGTEPVRRDSDGSEQQGLLGGGAVGAGRYGDAIEASA